MPKFGIEGPVYLTAKGAPPAANGTAAVGESDFLLDEEKQTVKSKDGRTSYTVSLLLAVSRYWRQIGLFMLEPGRGWHLRRCSTRWLSGSRLWRAQATGGTCRWS